MAYGTIEQFKRRRHKVKLRTRVDCACPYPPVCEHQKEWAQRNDHGWTRVGEPEEAVLPEATR
jgi:hypothetical protein